MRAAADLPGIEIVGVDVHIGSQITELAPFEAAFRAWSNWSRSLRADGHAITRARSGRRAGRALSHRQRAAAGPAAYGAMVARLTQGSRLPAHP